MPWIEGVWKKTLLALFSQHHRQCNPLEAQMLLKDLSPAMGIACFLVYIAKSSHFYERITQGLEQNCAGPIPRLCSERQKVLIQCLSHSHFSEGSREDSCYPNHPSRKHIVYLSGQVCCSFPTQLQQQMDNNDVWSLRFVVKSSQYLFRAIFKLTNGHRLQYICYSPKTPCRPWCSSSPVCKGAAPSLDKIHRIDLRPRQEFCSIVAPYHGWSMYIHVLKMSESSFRASATEELDSNFLAFGSLDHLGKWKSRSKSNPKEFLSKNPRLSIVSAMCLTFLFQFFHLYKRFHSKCKTSHELCHTLRSGPICSSNQLVVQR